MTTLTEWAALTDVERERLQAERTLRYAADAIDELEAMHRAQPDPSRPSRPFVSHAVWYVRLGSVDYPFRDFADAQEFAHNNTGETPR